MIIASRRSIPLLKAKFSNPFITLAVIPTSSVTTFVTTFGSTVSSFLNTYIKSFLFILTYEKGAGREFMKFYKSIEKEPQILRLFRVL